MKRLPPTRPLALATLAATLLCAVAVTNPVPASAADSSTANPAHVANVATRMPIDERIKSLHERLQITAEQESLWQPSHRSCARTRALWTRSDSPASTRATA